jgi:urea transport system ATP-binding protein
VDLLTIKGVHSYYGASHVLHGVNLNITQGSLTCVLGRNGMGKTTLLRTIMGLTPAKKGEIHFGDQRIEGKAPYAVYDLGLGYVPQGRHIFPYLTVEENLRLGLRNKRSKRSPLFEKIFDEFPVLRERLKQKGGTLSGGEQQMLAIARALAGEVTLLLLDEPTEGIQPSVVDEILERLSALNAQEGLTIVLVEQNMDMALSVADTYFVMEKGMVVEGGHVADIDKETVIERYLVV